MPSEKHFGKIKWFNDIKGYGFITALESGQDVFVDRYAMDSETIRELKEGKKVQFEVNQGIKGLQAINVTKL